MKSISSVYKIGNGPSSSHTVGPFHAAQTFGERYPDADSYEVTLFGSLAFTGEGHGTAKAIRAGLPGAKVISDTTTTDLPHPNTMLFRAIKGGKQIASVRIFSIGGGSIRIEKGLHQSSGWTKGCSPALRPLTKSSQDSSTAPKQRLILLPRHSLGIFSCWKYQTTPS